MFLQFIKKAIANIKEIHEMGLFGIMSNEDLYFIFNGSPMFYAILPILGMFITLQTAINGYELFKAHNKNFDRWFGFVASAVCATLTSISLYGSVAAAYYELNFALGPWFFLASLGAAVVHQLTMMGLNLYRTFESPSHSSQRKHFLQAAFNNLFNLILLSALMTSVVVIMISPISPAVGAACALTVVGLTATNLLWRIIPHDWKRGIKRLLGLGKPADDVQPSLEQRIEPDHSEKMTKGPEPHVQSIFKCAHSAVIKSKTIEEGANYLKEVIEEKIRVFNNYPLPHSEKNKQKKAFLTEVLDALKKDGVFSKKDLLTRYPLAFQSFWTLKGDVEQIVDAAEVLREKVNQESIECDQVLENGYHM